MINKEEKWRKYMSKCEECDADISIPSDALEGEIVTCPECGASFELTKGSDGFDLKPAQTVGEDWGQWVLTLQFFTITSVGKKKLY